MIEDPWFYAAAVPAILLVGVAKGPERDAGHSDRDDLPGDDEQAERPLTFAY